MLDPGLVQWMIDTGSKPSVVDGRQRFQAYDKLFKERFSKTFEDLRCNSDKDSAPENLVLGVVDYMLENENKGKEGSLNLSSLFKKRGRRRKKRADIEE